MFSCSLTHRFAHGALDCVVVAALDLVLDARPTRANLDCRRKERSSSGTREAETAQHNKRGTVVRSLSTPHLVFIRARCYWRQGTLWTGKTET